MIAVIGLVSIFWRGEPRREKRRTRLIAIAMALVFLFPAISISDDIWASLHPLREDGWSRRHDPTAQPHTFDQEHAPALLTCIFHAPGLVFLGHAPLLARPEPLPLAPVLFAPWIRPPPYL